MNFNPGFIKDEELEKVAFSGRGGALLGGMAGGLMGLMDDSNQYSIGLDGLQVKKPNMLWNALKGAAGGALVGGVGGKALQGANALRNAANAKGGLTGLVRDVRTGVQTGQKAFSAAQGARGAKGDILNTLDDLGTAFTKGRERFDTARSFRTGAGKGPAGPAGTAAPVAEPAVQGTGKVKGQKGPKGPANAAPKEAPPPRRWVDPAGKGGTTEVVMPDGSVRKLQSGQKFPEGAQTWDEWNAAHQNPQRFGPTVGQQMTGGKPISGPMAETDWAGMLGKAIGNVYHQVRARAADAVAAINKRLGRRGAPMPLDQYERAMYAQGVPKHGSVPQSMLLEMESQIVERANTKLAALLTSVQQRVNY